MTDKFEKSYYFNSDEFGLLLDSKGCSSLSCLNVFGSVVKISDKNAYTSLYSMMREGLISVEDEMFRIDDDLNSLITSITSAQKALTVLSRGSLQAVIYKHSDDYVLTQYDVRRKSNLKLTALEKSDIEETIAQDFGLDINETAEVEKELERNTDDMYLASLLLLNVTDDFSKLAESDKTVSLFEFYDIAQKQFYKRAAVIRHGIGLAAVIWDKKDVKVYPYSRDVLRRILNEDFMGV